MLTFSKKIPIEVSPLLGCHASEIGNWSPMFLDHYGLSECRELINQDVGHIPEERISHRYATKIQKLSNCV